MPCTPSDSQLMIALSVCDDDSYTKIVSGKINYPDSFSAVSEDLVSKLCSKVPSKRLGNMKGGIMDVKKHKFFGPFNWMVSRAEAHHRHHSPR